jgi:superfamily II DNA or RNA helicase
MSQTSDVGPLGRALSDVLDEREIVTFFSRSAFHKARAYQAEGRVLAVEVSEDLTRVRASVSGSERSPYQVDIRLDFAGDRLADLDGDCTCPMAFNCKHVAVSLLEALSGSDKLVDAALSPGRRLGAGRSLSPAAPTLPYEVTEWLERVGNATRGNDYPPEMTQRLLYCLGPSRDSAQMPSLAVSLLSARVTKGGELGGTITQPNAYGLTAERAPKYFRDCDIDILVQLSSHLQAYAYSVGHRPVSIELLRQIIATGRAFWLDYKGVQLRWGETRAGRLEWRQSGKRNVVPVLIAPGATVLNAEPPVYIDEAAGLVGPVEFGLSPRLAYQLLSAPAIPRAQLEEFSRRLGQKLPGEHHGLLPATPSAVVKIDEDPIPVLRLMLGRAASYGYYRHDGPDQVPVAHLSFRYGPAEIEPSERGARIEAFQDGQVYAIGRRRAKENEALKRLAALGFRQARSVFPALGDKHFHDLTFAKPYDWLDFLSVHVPQLRVDGFEIRIDDSFPYRLAESSGEFDAELESSGIDWFDLALGIEISGERHDLAPMLAALVLRADFDPETIRQLATEGNRFYLPLADGRHLLLAANRLLPLVLALHSLKLNGLSLDGRSGKIRLSRVDVVPLLALENEDFVFKGADNLRRLADLLHVHGQAGPRLPEGFRAELRPYQAQGVAWLDLLRESGLGGVLADDMGLGKTVQILALLALEKARGHLDAPALVVAPTSLMSNWLSEARKFAPDLKVLMLHGADRKQSFAAIAEHDVVLSTYPLIARDHEVLLSRQWHMAVLDEAQTVKNPNAATTRWLRGIRAKHRFCLTGTPMENHLGELWSVMSFANPGYLGDKVEFARRWRTPIEKRGDKYRAAALAQRVKPFLLRRTKAEVAAELPAKTEIVEHVVLEGDQRDLYDSIRLSMSDKVRKAIAERGLARSHIVVLEALLRMRQACCDPALLKLDDGVERESAKLDRLMEMVTELLSEGRKIIVFSQFTSMLDLIRNRFDAEHVRYSVLTGETRDRKSSIDGFQNGASDVFLISLKAGGVGINLTAADTVIIFDPWWNPAVEEQAIDRAHRIGQDKAVFVYRLTAVGTIEEKMDELKARKRALADSLFERDGRIASALTEEDVRALFDA